MTISVCETASSASSCNRQQIYHPHRLDRKDCTYIINELEKTRCHELGATAAELALMRFTLETCLPDTPENDKTLAHLMPVVKAALDFAQATNKTDPRGYTQGVHYHYGKMSTRLGIHQREMVRNTSQYAGTPEPGEWFFDQAWNLSCAAEPSFGINLQTLIHGADGREPKTFRHASMWVNGQMSETLLASMVGKTFGEVMDPAGTHADFIGKALDDWIIAYAANEEDGLIDNLTIKLKLSQP